MPGAVAVVDVSAITLLVWRFASPPVVLFVIADAPVLHVLLGWTVAGEHLAPIQIAGIVIVLGSISVAIVARAPKPAGSLHRRSYIRCAFIR